MKKSLQPLALAVLSVIPAGAAAQSNLSIYGVIDVAVRHTTGQPLAAGGSGGKTELSEGAFQGGRLGFKGAEELGNGLSAIFNLEGGLQIDDGQFDQQGQLFGRQAWVGLSSRDMGDLAAGRLYSIAYANLSNFDPLNVGNYPETNWEACLYGVRFDNALAYSKSWGPVAVALQYSFGEKNGNAGIGASSGAALTYGRGGVSLTGLFQQSKDANAKDMTVAGAGVSYVAGNSTGYFNYFRARRDAGFVKAASLSGGPLADTNLMGNAGNLRTRKDDVLTIGALFQAASNLDYTVGYMRDLIKDEVSSGAAGRISTFYAVADYKLSLRTDAYVSFDRSSVSGAEDGLNSVIGSFGGASSRTGFGLGLRHRF